MADARARIFISYRREDSAGHVLALLPELRRHFGDRVFKDTDNIPPGEDFVRVIKRELDSCSVLIAVIGRDWLNVQDPRLKTRRLDNPDDFLRIELSTALRSERIRVIPVLIERSTMPSAADLPPDLAELAHRNALELSDGRWESDVQLLIQAIQRVIAPAVERTEVLPRPELQDFQKRRAREIAAHLAAAQEAFDAQEYERTQLSCEKALLLDPNGIDALELLDRARKAIDNQKIEAWLKQARQSLRHRDTASASDFIDQALSIDPASETALGLRKEMLAVRRERERDRERSRAAAAQQARTSLDEEDFEHPEAERELERPGGARELDAVAESWSIRRYAIPGAAAAVLLSSALGLWQYQRPSEPGSAPETNQLSNPPGSAGRADPSVTAEASGRGTSSVPVPTPTPRPKADGKVGGNSAPASPTKPPETAPRRPSEPVPAPTAEPKADGTLAGSTVASSPTKPPGGRFSVSEMIMGPTLPPRPATPPDSGAGQPISKMIRETVEKIERQRITDVIQRYVTAYNSRNAAAIKELYPSFEGDVRGSFEKYELTGVTIELSPDSTSASVSANESSYYKGDTTPAMRECRFTLRKQGDSWIIISVTKGIIRNLRG